MLRLTTWWGLIIATILVLWVYGGWTCSTSSPHSPVGDSLQAPIGKDVENEKSQGSYTQSACDAFRPILGVKAPNVIAAFSALFAFLVLVITESSAERQLRAYVFVDTCAVRCDPLFPMQYPPGTTFAPIRLNFSIKNYGQTPAKMVVARTRLTIDGVEVQGKDDPIYGSLPPSETAQLSDRFDHQIPHGTYDRIGGFNQRVLSVAGAVSYIDAFGRRRKTQFRFHSTGFDSPGLVKFSLTEIGNDWT